MGHWFDSSTPHHPHFPPSRIDRSRSRWRALGMRALGVGAGFLAFTHALRKALKNTLDSYRRHIAEFFDYLIEVSVLLGSDRGSTSRGVGVRFQSGAPDTRHKHLFRCFFCACGKRKMCLLEACSAAPPAQLWWASDIPERGRRMMGRFGRRVLLEWPAYIVSIAFN